MSDPILEKAIHETEIGIDNILYIIAVTVDLNEIQLRMVQRHILLSQLKILKAMRE